MWHNGVVVVDEALAHYGVMNESGMLMSWNGMLEVLESAHILFFNLCFSFSDIFFLQACMKASLVRNVNNENCMKL